ncbi:MAG: DUF4191 domain-containing protein [Bifidobacteriaceae bacterium]|jgi:hypothetical protein|nr:DUF4191 domain-containing protein [Bifidobacteriaceae bacterium]
MKDNKEKIKKERFKTIKQIIEVFHFTTGFFPKLPFIFWTIFVAPIVITAVIGILTSFYFLILLGVLVGVLGALFTLSRFADKAGFKNVEGQLGASGAILSSINIGGFSFEENPVAINGKFHDLVFRGVGRPGVVLVSEGPSARVRPMLENERKKIARILPNVPVIKIECGNAPGQVPLKKLKKTIVRQKVSLTKAELQEILKRLRAIGGFRLPIPKGIDPQNVRQSRKGLR